MHENHTKMLTSKRMNLTSHTKQIAHNLPSEQVNHNESTNLEIGQTYDDPMTMYNNETVSGLFLFCFMMPNSA